MRTTNGVRWPLQDEAADPASGGGAKGEAKADAGLGTMEERASRMGWTPKEQFRGDPAKWVDATVFVKNGEESLPILRERLRSSERARADLEKSVVEVRKMNETVFQRAYDKAKKDLEGQVKSAAKAGDEAGAAAAATELAELERQKAERDVAAKADPVFDGWVDENPWYKDADLVVEAEGEAFKLRRRMAAGKEKMLEGRPFLERVKEEMKKRFPDHAAFGNPRRQAASGVERPSGGGEPGSGGKKGWEHLPSEAKQAGERFIKQKLVKDKSAYAEQYWAQEAT